MREAAMRVRIKCCVMFIGFVATVLYGHFHRFVIKHRKAMIAQEMRLKTHRAHP